MLMISRCRFMAGISASGRTSAAPPTHKLVRVGIGTCVYALTKPLFYLRMHAEIEKGFCERVDTGSNADTDKLVRWRRGARPS